MADKIAKPIIESKSFKLPNYSLGSPLKNSNKNVTITKSIFLFQPNYQFPPQDSGPKIIEQSEPNSKTSSKNINLINQFKSDLKNYCNIKVSDPNNSTDGIIAESKPIQNYKISKNYPQHLSLATKNHSRENSTNTISKSISNSFIKGRLELRNNLYSSNKFSNR